jgi:hypothetical protein
MTIIPINVVVGGRTGSKMTDGAVVVVVGPGNDGATIPSDGVDSDRAETAREEEEKKLLTVARDCRLIVGTEQNAITRLCGAFIGSSQVPVSRRVARDTMQCSDVSARVASNIKQC